MGAKKILLSIIGKKSFFNFLCKNRMIYSNKNKDELSDFEKLKDLYSKLKEVRLEEKLGERDFHCVIKRLFEIITKKSEIQVKNFSRRVDPLEKQSRN